VSTAGHVFWPEAVLPAAMIELRQAETARQVTDRYLLGLARRFGRRVVTCDHGLVAFFVGEPAGTDEPNLFAVRIGSQDPGDFFHLANARLVPIAVACAGCNSKGNPLIPVRQLIALDDLVSELRPANERRPAACFAQRALPVIDSASSYFDTHGVLLNS
jgi:hypothetical protein